MNPSVTPVLQKYFLVYWDLPFLCLRLYREGKGGRTVYNILISLEQFTPRIYCFLGSFTATVLQSTPPDPQQASAIFGSFLYIFEFFSDDNFVYKPKQFQLNVGEVRRGTCMEGRGTLCNFGELGRLADGGRLVGCQGLT